MWLRRNPKHRRAVKLFLGLALLGITVRMLPYLAPIRAKDLVQDDLAVEFRDRNGLSLGTILSRDQDHTAVVPLDQISTHFIHAILAAEDGEFYNHGALEMRAIMRSLIEAIEGETHCQWCLHHHHATGTDARTPTPALYLPNSKKFGYPGD